MADIDLTVIFTIYNNIGEAEVTVASLMEQTYRAAEVIISDDGSAGVDAAQLEGIAERLRGHYAQVRVNINEKNLGTVAHVNRLYAMAQGRYIMGCSPGDRFHSPRTLEHMVRRMERGGELLVTARRLDVYDDHSKVRPGRWLGLALRFCPRWLMNHMIQKHSLISSCCTVYQKALYETQGYQDEGYRLLDDFPYYVTLLQRGVRIGFTSEVILEHRMGGGVSTGTIHPQIHRDLERMQEQLLADPVGLSRRTVALLRQRVEERTHGT